MAHWFNKILKYKSFLTISGAYGNMIASNTAEISNTASFISSIAKCEYPFINDPDYSLRCCFEDNSNEGISNLLSDSTTLEKKYDKQNLSIMYCSKFLGAFCWVKGEYQRSQLKSLISRYINWFTGHKVFDKYPFFVDSKIPLLKCRTVPL